MRKRLLATTVAILLSVLWSVNLLADTQGTFDGNKNISWTYTGDGTVTITGTGKIPELGSSTSPWYNDANVKKVVIGEGITRIGSNTFPRCTNLTEVSLPSTLKEIGQNAFCFCNLVNGITFPESLETIEQQAFDYCKLTSINLPGNLKYIGHEAFASNEIKSVTIPKSLTGLVSTAFDGKVLEELKVEEGNTAYTSRDKDGTELNAILSIDGTTLCRGCKNTKIPESVTTIGADAFNHCLGLTEFTIPDQVTKIESYAFSFCQKLVKLSIGSGVTEIGRSAFEFCYGLKEITIYALNPPTCGDGCFNNIYSNCTLSCVRSAYNTYKEAWAKFNLDIILTEPRVYAEYDSNTQCLKFFYNNKMSFTEGVDVIDNMTIDKYICSFKDSIREYMKEKTGKDDYAYSYIKSVDLDESFKNFKPKTCSKLFLNFESMETISHLEYLNTENVTHMDDMFYYCKALKSLDLSTFNTEKVTSFMCMFSGCKNLEKLDLTSFNTSNCTNMYGMFQSCSGLKSLDISTFDTHLTSDMSYMFPAYGNAKIYVSDKFVTDNLSEGNDKGMFSGNDGGMDKCYANYTNDDGKFLKKVGTIGGEPLGAKGTKLTVAELNITDDKRLVLTETDRVIATTASYSREMTSKWGTLCLPYIIDTKNESNSCKYYKVKSIGSEAITLQEIIDRIPASTPVIFCRTNESSTVSIPGYGALTVQGGQTENLVGTFTDQIIPDDAYFIANGAFRLAGNYKGIDGSKGVKVGAYRSYIRNAQNAGANTLSIFTGEATAIDGISNTADNTAIEYYDLTGKRLDAPHKGVNIVKMGGKTKKVIVK